MTGNVSDWLSYAGGTLIKVADSAGSTVIPKQCNFWKKIIKTVKTRSLHHKHE